MHSDFSLYFWGWLQLCCWNCLQFSFFWSVCDEAANLYLKLLYAKFQNFSWDTFCYQGHVGYQLVSLGGGKIGLVWDGIKDFCVSDGRCSEVLWGTKSRCRLLLYSWQAVLCFWVSLGRIFGIAVFLTTLKNPCLFCLPLCLLHAFHQSSLLWSAFCWISV